MHFQDITMILFAACNGIRVVAYLPQIHKAFTHRNGASAISRTTWGLFLIANVSTVAYAIVNRSDYWLAACFGVNSICCAVILLATYSGGLRFRTSAWDSGWRSFRRLSAFSPSRPSRKQFGPAIEG